MWCRDGTTDVTRSFHYGTPSDKVKVNSTFLLTVVMKLRIQVRISAEDAVKMKLRSVGY